MQSILHIGAGQASELPQMLETGAEQIVLVEPNPDMAEQLRQRTAQHPQVTVVEAAITTNPVNNKLQEYNLPEASSLYPATGLKTLFPGLRVKTTHKVATLSPEQLLAEHGPQSGKQAMLAIQVPGEEHAILKSLMNTDDLKQFSELRVNANPTPYFEGSVAAEQTLQALVNYGYEITDDNQQDPNWPSWQLARCKQRDEISALRAENMELNNRISALTEELAITQKKLDVQLATSTQLDALQKNISTVGIDLTNHLDKKLASTAKLIENVVGLQNYLNTGDLPLNQQGWSINTDLVMFLIEKLEAEKYDLIIEFGSGNSTVLFGKVMMKMLSNQQQSESSCDSDIPKRVLTFEHNTHYYEQSSAKLRQTGVDHMVELVHAPLVEYDHQDNQYLYYDCDKALSKMSKYFEKKTPKILVLVDGPPGDTGIHARFPALPKLLKYFSQANIDLILDDYIRPEEKAVADNWIELVNKRAISYTEEKIPLEKGAICVSIGVSASQNRQAYC